MFWSKSLFHDIHMIFLFIIYIIFYFIYIMLHNKGKQLVTCVSAELNIFTMISGEQSCREAIGECDDPIQRTDGENNYTAAVHKAVCR